MNEQRQWWSKRIDELNAEMSLSLAREQRLAADLNEVGAAFSQLYLMALNGVVCDPTADPPCRYCKGFWKKGKAVLDRLDPGWGSMGRSFKLPERTPGLGPRSGDLPPTNAKGESEASDSSLRLKAETAYGRLERRLSEVLRERDERVALSEDERVALIARLDGSQTQLRLPHYKQLLASSRAKLLSEHPGTDAASAKPASCKSKEGGSSVPDGEGR